MSQCLILYAPSDADRAEALAAHMRDVLVLRLPFEAARVGLKVGAQVVRIVLWSRAAEADAASLQDVVREGALAFVCFEGVEPPSGLARRGVVVAAAADGAETIAALQQALSRRGAGTGARPQVVASARPTAVARPSVSVARPAAVRPAQPAPAWPARRASVQRPSGARAFGLRKLAPGLAVSAAAFGIAASVGYVAHLETTRLLRVADSPADAAMALGGAPLVRARFETVTSVRAEGWSQVEPAFTAEELGRRVDARLSARRTQADSQIESLRDLAARAVAAQPLAQIEAPAPIATALIERPVEVSPAPTLARLPAEADFAGDVIIGVLPQG